MFSRRNFLAELTTILRLGAPLSQLNKITKVPAISSEPDSDDTSRRSFVSVKDFGAIADGQSHPLSSLFDSLSKAQETYPFAVSLEDEIDWCACEAAARYCRSSSIGTFTGPSQGGVELRLSGQLRVNKTIFFGTQRDAKTRDRGAFIQKIVGVNCLVYSSALGVPAIDLSGNRFSHIEDICVVGDKESPPSVGFLFGRTGVYSNRNSLRSSGLNYCLRLRTQGYFSVAALYNYGSEGDRFEHCRFRVDGGKASAVCVLAASNEFRIHSVVANTDVKTKPYIRQASNWPFFTDCDFIAKNVPDFEAAISVYGGQRLRVHGGLIDTASSNGISSIHIMCSSDEDKRFAAASLEFQGILHHRTHQISYLFNCSVRGVTILNAAATGKNSQVKVKLNPGFKLSNALVFYDVLVGSVEDVSGLVNDSGSQ